MATPVWIYWSAERTLSPPVVAASFPRHVPALLGLVDPDRLLFGSDYCWTPPLVANSHIAAVDAARSPVEGLTWRSLTMANARRLFPRLAR